MSFWTFKGIQEAAQTAMLRRAILSKNMESESTQLPLPQKDVFERAVPQQKTAMTPTVPLDETPLQYKSRQEIDLDYEAYNPAKMTSPRNKLRKQYRKLYRQQVALLNQTSLKPRTLEEKLAQFQKVEGPTDDFHQTVEFISNKDYRSMKREDISEIKDPYGSAQIIRRHDQPTLTEWVVDCSAGGITNPKRVSKFHLYPERSVAKSEEGKIQNILGKDAELLSKEGPLHGFIFGGRDFLEKEESYFPSKKLYRNLKTVMASHEIPVTCIWGRATKQMNGESSLLYNPEKRTWYVNAQRYAGGDGDREDILTLAQLLETFKTVKLSKGTRLVTKDGVYIQKEY